VLERDAARARTRPRAPEPGVEPSLRSRRALDAVNFFLAQLTGIGLPFLSDFLRDRGWLVREIGIAASMSALGVLLLQTPAGLLLDRFCRPRRALAVAAIAVGACYATLPLLPAMPFAFTHLTLFASGLAQAFFAPALAGLALGIAGHESLNRVYGVNQAWNNVGNALGAAVVLALVGAGVAVLYYGLGLIGLLVAAAAYAIQPDELDRSRSCGGHHDSKGLWKLLRDRRVLVLLAATTLSQVATSSAMPFVALRLRDLGGSDRDLGVLILVGQAVAAPAALFAGRLVDAWGRKPVFAIGLCLEPLRVLLCAFAPNAWSLIAVQALAGMSMGIFGVAIVAVTADLSRGSGRFNSFTGASRTAYALAAVVGPLATGLFVREGGYALGFGALAAVSAVGAAVFVARMPETRPTPGVRSVAPPRFLEKSHRATRSRRP
jgi:MFS family permease